MVLEVVLVVLEVVLQLLLLQLLLLQLRVLLKLPSPPGGGGGGDFIFRQRHYQFSICFLVLSLAVDDGHPSSSVILRIMGQLHGGSRHCNQTSKQSPKPFRPCTKGLIRAQETPPRMTPGRHT